jgi:hypothetical protein
MKQSPAMRTKVSVLLTLKRYKSEQKQNAKLFQKRKGKSCFSFLFARKKKERIGVA